MKKYYEYFEEISENKLLEGLLGYGLFSDKLPPIFTNQYFFNFIKQNYFNKNKPLPFELKNGRDYVRYENIRNINVPRNLAIPNPFAFAKLCEIICKNYENLRDYFKEKTKSHNHKISRIHLRRLKGKKYLFEMNYKNFFLDEEPSLNLMIGKRYLVKTDISNCFPSIYSHSIPWAIKGRPKSKEDKSHWSDKLDKASILIKHNETNGLLIGPHTSNLLSEIILCAVDDEVSKKGYTFLRKIDDYQCYAETFEEAEKFLLDLSQELKKYNLNLNLKKTTINPLPIATAEDWVHQLNSHVFLMEKEIINLTSMRNFWNFVIELFYKNNFNSAILNYAIKIISKKNLNQYAKEYHLKMVNHLVILYPYLVSLLEEFIFKPFVGNNISLIKSFSDSILDYSISKNLYESSSYALFFAINYNFKLNIESLYKLYTIAENSSDAVFTLISYLYTKKYLNNRHDINNYKLLAERLRKNGFEDKYWIFIYETLPKSKLSSGFKYIKKQNIHFLKDIYYV